MKKNFKLIDLNLNIFKRMDFVSVNLMGGLGNLMFQVATAYAFGVKNNKKFICEPKQIEIPHKPFSVYTTNILRKIDFINSIQIMHEYNEVNFHYNEIPNIDGNIRLFGYFQSEKYFLKYRNEILNLFEIDDNTLKKINKIYKSILNEDTCSIHVRRGDYLKLPNHHPTQHIEYYLNSVELMGNDKHYLIFSDDINWCNDNFDFIKNKTFISGTYDFEDLYLMSMCKNNIIANSSFSWWSAWLNQNLNKKIIAPKIWFGNYLNHNTNDLYCNNWIKL